MRATIGISQCFDEGELRKNRETLYLDLAYADAVERAGGLALQLPLQRSALDLIERVDALLIPGGDDFAPPADRDYPREVFDLTPERQIDFDRRLLDAALAHGIPVLGVCYGMQLLALYHGGSLHYHLPTDVPAAAPHRAEDSSDSGNGEVRHQVALEPGTKLAELIGRSAQVNSRHHQSVADPGRGLTVSARSPDGIIEAIEGGLCVGVQWHPETLTGAAGEGLFRWLVESARTASRAEPAL